MLVRLHLESRMTSLLLGPLHSSTVAKICWCHSYLEFESVMCFYFPSHRTPPVWCHKCIGWYVCEHLLDLNPSIERVEINNPTIGANSIPIWDHGGMNSVMCTWKKTYFTITVSILIHVWTQWMALFIKINMPLKLHYVASFMFRWMSQTPINQREEIMRVFLWRF